MVDLTSEMVKLRAALGSGPGESGRVVLFVAAQGGEGVSTVAREYARIAAANSRRPIWLVDADLDGQRQLKIMDAASDRFGDLGDEAGATPDGSGFFRIDPPLLNKEGKAVAPIRLAFARPALGGRLWVTQLRRELLSKGQTLTVETAPDYWDALRKHASEIVIDTPAADRSDTAIKLAPCADLVVLVVASERAAPEAAVALRHRIEAAGGKVAGLVFNRSDSQPPGPFKRRAS